MYIRFLRDLVTGYTLVENSTPFMSIVTTLFKQLEHVQVLVSHTIEAVSIDVLYIPLGG
jgi:hypothetical protein